ncbi:hypothetical protein GCM10027034_29380 [Ramlibacter solisilvae]
MPDMTMAATAVVMRPPVARCHRTLEVRAASRCSELSAPVSATHVATAHMATACVPTALVSTACVTTACVTTAPVATTRLAAARALGCDRHRQQTQQGCDNDVLESTSPHAELQCLPYGHLTAAVVGPADLGRSSLSA